MPDGEPRPESEHSYRRTLGVVFLGLAEREVRTLSMLAGFGPHALEHVRLADLARGEAGDGCADCIAYGDWLRRLRDLVGEPLSCWEGQATAREIVMQQQALAHQLGAVAPPTP